LEKSTLVVLFWLSVAIAIVMTIFSYGYSLLHPIPDTCDIHLNGNVKGLGSPCLSANFNLFDLLVGIMQLGSWIIWCVPFVIYDEMKRKFRRN